MAIIDVVTQVGLDLNAQSFTPGNRPAVTSIRVGTGHVADQAAAIALTDLVAHTAAYDHNNPPVEAEGNEAQTTYVNTNRAQQYPIHEIGVFSGNNLIKYVCNDDGTPLLTKSVGLILLIPLRIVYSNGEAQIMGADYSVAPLASKQIHGLMRFGSPDEENAGTSELLGATIAGIRRMISRFSAPFSINSLPGSTPTRSTWLAGRAGSSNRQFAVTAILRLMNRDDMRIFTGKGGTVLPTNPAPRAGDYFRFAAAVANGLNWRDTNGFTVITSAAEGDVARYSGANWVKQTKQAGDIFQVIE